MSTGQVLQESFNTTILGMGLVIITLYVLSLILDLMKTIFADKKSTKTEIIDKSQSSKESIDEIDNEQQEDDPELIAVITAAIAETLQTPVYTFKVGRIRQIHKNTPIWGISSRMHNINNKL